MSSTVSVALVGISGYGDSYLEELLNNPARSHFQIVGVVDPAPQRSRHLEQLGQRRIPIHPDLETLYRRDRPDLAIIVTPIHVHAPHTCTALAHGSNVLCEKPLAATLEEARTMLAANRSAGGFAAIGYQWSFSRAIQLLKQDIMAGDFGRPIRLKTLVSFPRGLKYFHRNDWAGRIRTDDGAAVFDSPVNNATSHFLHNMLYVLGRQRELSAVPVSVQAELYRANEIESFDTAAIRCRTSCGAELLFYTSQSVPLAVGPVVHFRFEHATVYYEAESGGGFVARLHNGQIRRYGDPNINRHLKIWESIDAVREGGRRIACGIPAATAQTICVAAAHASMPQICCFPGQLIGMVELPDGDRMKTVTGLPAALVQCYDQEILPSEHRGLEWAKAGRDVDVREPQWRC